MRRLWRAASQPREFFASLEDQSQLREVLGPALASVTAGALVFALAIARATASDAWLPLLVFVVPGAVIYVGVLWLFGGLALSRVAAIDLRGWEIAGWAWVPSGFMGLSLLPVTAVFPVTSLIIGTLGLPVWHLAVVRAGLAEFAQKRQQRALLIYALVVLAAPLLALAVILAALLAG